ncbi:MAG: hypothetical protein ABF246_12060 [Winogradskyella sp.]
MTNYKEKDLFEWLNKNHYNTLVNSRNPISRWDCYDVETRNRIELKCRRKHYDTLLLEKAKYDALIKESNKHLDVPIYINSTPKGIYLFNLLEVELKWYTKSLPATTEFQKRMWIKKEVTELKIEQAIKLK